MKNLFTLFSLVLSFNLGAAITLISDLDDTIKITNADDPAEATRRGIFSDDVFIGMPEFLRAVRHYVDEVHVLSASPSVIRYKIETTFKKKGISVDSITLKSPFQRQTTFEYKMEAIINLMNKNSGDDFILIGDDVDQDPAVFEEIKKLYPNRVLASYIHVVKNRDAKSSMKYWTAYDLFLREFRARRMQESEVALAGDRMLGEFRMGHIIPDFADCPQTPKVWLWQIRTRFALDAAALIAKINFYCAARSSTIHEL